MDLHFQTWGDGPPLVLLHGLFGSGDNWATIARQLAPHYRVIAVDLRNHGRSPHSPTLSYAEMAEDVRACCDVLQLEQIHLLGHSMGAKVALQFAVQFPERVASLVLVDMAMRAYADAHSHLIEAMLKVDLHAMPSRHAVGNALATAIPELMVRQFLLTNLVTVDAQLQWRLNLPALKADYPQLQMAITPTQTLAMPSLLIYGGKSDYVQAADIAAFEQSMTRLKVAPLPTGHWVHAEQPQLFAQVVLDFLNNPSS